VKQNLGMRKVVCTKLKAHYKHLYSSFAVSVEVDSSDMRQAIDVFMSADSWLSGVLVRRYFKPKDGVRAE